MPDNVRNFELQLDAEWAEKVEETSEFIQAVGLDGLRRVINKSPVLSGRFKGNWNIGIGSIDASTTENVDPSGGTTLARGTTALTSYNERGFPIINISNSLPYGPKLEDGSSSQAPGGVVGLTLAELNAAFANQTI